MSTAEEEERKEPEEKLEDEQPSPKKQRSNHSLEEIQAKVNQLINDVNGSQPEEALKARSKATGKLIEKFDQDLEKLKAAGESADNQIQQVFAECEEGIATEQDTKNQLVKDRDKMFGEGNPKEIREGLETDISNAKAAFVATCVPSLMNSRKKYNEAVDSLVDAPKACTEFLDVFQRVKAYEVADGENRLDMNEHRHVPNAEIDIRNNNCDFPADAAVELAQGIREMTELDDIAEEIEYLDIFDRFMENIAKADENLKFFQGERKKCVDIRSAIAKGIRKCVEEINARKERLTEKKASLDAIIEEGLKE